MNGPVPCGAVAGLIPSPIAWIAVIGSLKMLGSAATGVLVTIVRVCPSALIEAIGNWAWARTLVAMAYSREAFTACAVIGLPLWNVTLSRRVKVQVSGSTFFHSVASLGIRFSF